MLTNGSLYEDPGGDYFDKRAKATQTKRLVVRLKSLGFDVPITPVTEPVRNSVCGA